VDNLDEDVFPTPSKKRITEIIRDLIARLNPEVPQEGQGQQSEDSDISIVSESEPVKRRRVDGGLQDELEMALNAVKETNSFKNTGLQTKNLFTTIKQETALFESNKTRGFHLELAYKYLKTIPPTSVESERAFSASGYFCNRIRSRLSDASLDQLCFLRSYFQLNEN